MGNVAVRADTDGMETNEIESLSSTTTPLVTTTTPDLGSAGCPLKGTMVSWKGTRLSQIMFTGVSTAFIKISVFNNALSLVNLYEDDYTGFIAFTKKWCGMDVINAFEDGRLTWELADNGPFN